MSVSPGDPLQVTDFAHAMIGCPPFHSEISLTPGRVRIDSISFLISRLLQVARIRVLISGFSWVTPGPDKIKRIYLEKVICSTNALGSRPLVTVAFINEPSSAIAKTNPPFSIQVPL